LPDLERELVATLERLADGDVSQSEIAAAASALTFSLASSFEDPGNAAVTLGSYATLYDWRLVNELPELWAAVTPEDLARVTTHYFAPERRVIGVLHRGTIPWCKRGPTTGQWEGRSRNSPSRARTFYPAPCRGLKASSRLG
jgi:predicted Zn-dependent peptidase